MDHDALINAIRVESGALVFALEGAEDDDLVSTCHGWTVRDLAIHVGEFSGFWAHVLCEGTGRPKTPFPDPPSSGDLAPWVALTLQFLMEELEATPADTAVWTWFEADHTAGFVTRRCAHEVAVHRFDAQSATGIHTPIPTELAADGIDEVLDVLVTTREHSQRGSGRVLALRSTDVGMEWLVTLGLDRINVERKSQDEAPHDGSDLVVSGTASDLELTLYHRPTLSPVDVHGDYTVLDEWHREFTF